MVLHLFSSLDFGTESSVIVGQPVKGGADARNLILKFLQRNPKNAYSMGKEN